MKTIFPGREWRDRRFRKFKADVEAGRAAKVVRELDPISGQHGEVATCCRYFNKKIWRMRYDEDRDLGMWILSGVVESVYRMFGPLLKDSATR